MDTFANLPKDERQVYFEQTAAEMGLATQIIEKDFWVCWTLNVLFSLADYRDHLTFKGGTSLSKVYNAIERFSEDIDFAMSRELLGFGGDNAPNAQGASYRIREQRLEDLSTACRKTIKSDFYPKFEGEIRKRLNGDDWTLTFEESEKQNQVFRFEYPSTTATINSNYNPPIVKIELTARTDNHPSEDANVKPFIVDYFSDVITDSITSVNVLRAERTFWEKATILHQFHHQNDPARIADRLSRHYYDVVQLVDKGIADRAIVEIELLQLVADHKKVFYRQGWARYDLARDPKTLKLIPNSDIIPTLARDYLAMQEMIFGHSPTFEEILQCLAALETKINSL